MAPLLISGIASVASTAIDAWNNASQRRIAVEQGKFNEAFNKAMGIAPTTSLTPAAPTAQSLESQLRNAPEIRGILDTQDPTRSSSLSVTGEGRVFLQTPGNPATELTVSQDTRELAKQLNSALTGAAAVHSFSTPAAGALASFAR